eukprot:1888934-Rhodomonas_salina.1
MLLILLPRLRLSDAHHEGGKVRERRTREGGLEREMGGMEGVSECGSEGVRVGGRDKGIDGWRKGGGKGGEEGEEGEEGAIE